MGQVISSVLRYMSVQVKRDELDNESLISDVQEHSYSITIYPNNDNESHQEDSIFSPLFFRTTHPHPLPGDATVIVDDTTTTTTTTTPSMDSTCDSHSCVGENSSLEEETKEVYVEDNNLIRNYIPNKVVEERRIGDYRSSQRMLLVGEGDFSFSASLAEAFGTAVNMVATSLDSHEFLHRNYKHAISNISKLTERGATVLHGVDCTKMEDLFTSMRFDRIIYNFPHNGFFGRDEARESQLIRHRRLVRMFIANAKKLVKKKGGEIHITHKSRGFFLEWDLKSMALEEGLLLLQEVPFNRKQYPGYHTMCGFGGNMFFFCHPSKTYKFGHPINYIDL